MNLEVTQEAPADPLRELRAGVVVEGKYRVDRVIGRGGMGVVVAATHLDLAEPVALKFLMVKESADGESASDFQARFALEARVCAKLRNEHIARVRDVGVWQGTVPFMVMEYLSGIDLRRTLKAEGKLSLARAVDCAVQICQGLAEAHAQGIVHRDLKPANVFLTKRDGAELVKVLDFGISKWTSSGEELNELTKTGMMLGSPKYMSPEQLNGAKVDARADVWSIGAILYEMLTGRPPYDYANVTRTFVAIASGTPPPLASMMEPGIPTALDAVLMGCLTHDRDERTQNVAELAGALLDAVESPLASHVKAQIAAVLAPAVLTPDRTSSLPQRTLTTGSHAAFAMGSTGVTPGARPVPDPSVLAPAVASEPRGTKRWMGASAAAATVAVFVVAGMVATSTSSELGAGAARAVALKSVTAKTFAGEPPTTMRAVPVTASESAPVGRARTVSSKPPPVAPAAVTVAPAPAPASTPPPARPATPAKSANPLEDRQ